MKSPETRRLPSDLRFEREKAAEHGVVRLWGHHSADPT